MAAGGREPVGQVAGARPERGELQVPGPAELDPRAVEAGLELPEPVPGVVWIVLRRDAPEVVVAAARLRRGFYRLLLRDIGRH